MASKKKKQSLTPKQIEEQKAREKKRLEYEAYVHRLPSTFALVTAQRLLARLGVSLKQESISAQIQQPQTYYHALLYAPAKRTAIQGYVERCRDIQAYGQQKLIHYLFSGEASKQDDETGHEMREQIESFRLHMVDMGKDFIDWEENCSERSENVFNELKERSLAWHRTVKAVLIDLLKTLSGQESITINNKFDRVAYAFLLESSAKIVLSKQQEKQYMTLEKVGIIEKTVIYLAEKSFLNGLNAESLIKMRDDFLLLDARLQAEYDSLTGFNATAREEAKSDIKTMDDFTEGFEKAIVKISQSLFKYYKEYATDKALKVESGEAFEFGVDEAVADDYRALHV